MWQSRIYSTHKVWVWNFQKIITPLKDHHHLPGHPCARHQSVPALMWKVDYFSTNVIIDHWSLIKEQMCFSIAQDHQSWLWCLCLWYNHNVIGVYSNGDGVGDGDSEGDIDGVDCHQRHRHHHHRCHHKHRWHQPTQGRAQRRTAEVLFSTPPWGRRSCKEKLANQKRKS